MEIYLKPPKEGGYEYWDFSKPEYGFCFKGLLLEDISDNDI